MNIASAYKAFKVNGRWTGPSQFTPGTFTILAGSFAAAAKTIDRMRPKHFISGTLSKSESRARFRSNSIELVSGLLIFSRK